MEQPNLASFDSIDRVLNNYNTTGASDVLPRDTTILALGCLATNINSFTGTMDQIRLYNHTLSETEINNIYSAESLGYSDVVYSSAKASSATQPATKVSSNGATNGAGTNTDSTPDSNPEANPPKAKPDNKPTSKGTVIALSVVGALLGAGLIAIVIYLIIVRQNKTYTQRRDEQDRHEKELEEKAKREAQNI